MRMWVPSLALISGLRIQHCHELWCRSQTRLRSALLWLWLWLAAVAPIGPLIWELPYAIGVALKSKKRKKKKKKEKKKSICEMSIQFFSFLFLRPLYSFAFFFFFFLHILQIYFVYSLNWVLFHGLVINVTKETELRSTYQTQNKANLFSGYDEIN